MSNVLIGIIGVILFIGLALAGALFLGPRFQEASNSSKAASVAAALQQTSAATNLYRVEGGRALPSSVAGNVGDILVAARYMKSTPTNGFNGGVIAAIDDDGGHSDRPTTYVYTDLGTDSKARAVCRSIERNAGNSNPDADLDQNRDFKPVAAGTRRIGCFSNFVRSYQAYAPV